MLRPLFVISALTTAMALSGCQSIMGHSIMGQGSTQATDSNIKHARNTYLKSAVAYNTWQWEYLTKQANKISEQSSNVMTSTEPKAAAEADDGTVWGYDYQPNTVHPLHWGNVSGNKQCSTGQKQSPINITQALIPATLNSYKQIQYDYQPQDFVVTNNGRTIAFTAVDDTASKFAVNGKQYRLVRFQYHSPSEHTIMNVHYPLELQFVHKSEDGEVAIIASLVNIGQQNMSLQAVIDNVPSANSQRSKNRLADFDVSSLIPQGYFYAYTGSWTQPPCLEKTPWLIGSQTIKASSSQVHSLRSRFYGNNRPVQPQNNRTVFMIK